MSGAPAGPTSTDPASRRRRVVWGLVVVAVIVAVGWVVGSGGWPGEPSGCIAAGDCSCEAFGDGLVIQPVNAVSSLVFIAAALGLLSAGGSSLGVPYAVLVGSLGVGSAAFHTSVTEWGGWLDLVAIHALLIYVVTLDAAMLFRRSRAWVLRFSATATVVAALILWWVDNGLGKYGIAALLFTFAALEWGLRQRPTGRDGRRLRWAAGLGAVGLVVQWLGRGGGPLCDADSLLQVHAVWHAIAAAAAVMLYRYLFVEAGTGARSAQ